MLAEIRAQVGGLRANAGHIAAVGIAEPENGMHASARAIGQVKGGAFDCAPRASSNALQARETLRNLEYHASLNGGSLWRRGIYKGVEPPCSELP